MLSNYTLSADFEDIDSPELVASAIYVLQNHGWNVSHYEDTSIEAKKKALSGITVNLRLEISKKKVTIFGEGNLTEDAIKLTVDQFAIDLLNFISAPGFDYRVAELKHHYFMSNPIESEVSHEHAEQESLIKSFIGFRKRFRATPAIIILNVLVFVLMVISGVNIFMPETSEILLWGGNMRTYVLQGEWWRLLTCCFVHIGLLHILFNMWALYNIGFFLESMIGTWRFTFAYLIAGLAGSLNSIIWHPATTSAGASGAIFGMFGLFLALLTTNLLEKGFRSSMLQSVLLMILINLIIGTTAHIDNAGHIGGLIAGMVSGYLYAWHYKKPKNALINLLSFALPAVFLLVAGIVVANKLPDPYHQYDVIIKKVSELEKRALDLERDKNTGIVSDSAIIRWDEAIRELQKTKDLELREEIVAHNERLSFYLEKRRTVAYLLCNEPDNKLKLQQTENSLDSILKVLNTQK